MKNFLFTAIFLFSSVGQILNGAAADLLSLDEEDVMFPRVERWEKKLEDPVFIEKLSKDRLVQIGGGLHYGMTKDQMDQFARGKICSLYNQGKIITKEAFEAIKDEYYLRKGHANLTRIWGSEYLKKAFIDNKLENGYDVPDYVIVLDDAQKVTIELTLSWGAPIISEIVGPQIYFKNISGKSAIPHYNGRRTEDYTLKSLGYGDFADPGNVLSFNGKRFVIDTEWKSFSDQMRQGLDRNTNLFFQYMKQRFEKLNPNVLQSWAIEINLEQCAR